MKIFHFPRRLESRSMDQGTGSYPFPPQGWHLEIRFTDNQNPLNKPYRLNASRAYWEQVGVYRHLGPIQGEMTNW